MPACCSCRPRHRCRRARIRPDAPPDAEEARASPPGSRAAARPRAGGPHPRRAGILGPALRALARDPGAAARYRDRRRDRARLLPDGTAPLRDPRSRHRLGLPPGRAAARTARRPSASASTGPLGALRDGAGQRPAQRGRRPSPSSCPTGRRPSRAVRPDRLESALYRRRARSTASTRGPRARSRGWPSTAAPDGLDAYRIISPSAAAPRCRRAVWSWRSATIRRGMPRLRGPGP